MSANILSGDLIMFNFRNNQGMFEYFNAGPVDANGNYPAVLTPLTPTSTTLPVPLEIISGANGTPITTNAPFYIVTTTLNNQTLYLSPVLNGNSTIQSLQWSAVPTPWQVSTMDTFPVTYDNTYNLITNVNGIPVAYPTVLYVTRLADYCNNNPQFQIPGCSNLTPFPSPSVSTLPTVTPTTVTPTTVTPTTVTPTVTPVVNRPWWDRLGFWIFLGIVIVALIVIITLIIVAATHKR